MGRYVTDPYFTQSPIGEGIAELGKAFISGSGNAYKNRLYQSEAEKAQLEAGLLRRKGTGFDETAALAGKSDFNPADQAALRAAFVRGGGDVSKLGDLLRATAFTQQGTPQPMRDSVYMAGGGSAGNTETGHKDTLANAITRTGMEQGGAMARTQAQIASHEALTRDMDARTLMPVMLPGGPESGGPSLAMRPKSQVGSPMFAGTPVLEKGMYSPTEGTGGQTTLQPNMPGLAVQAPNKGSLHNYQTPDGKVGMTVDGQRDLHTGAALPPQSQVFQTQTPSVGNAEAGNVRQSDQNLDQIDNNIRDMLGALSKSPNSMGAVGGARDLVQNLLQQGEMAGRTLGMNTQAIRDQVAKYDPQLAMQFDPNLPLVDQKRKMLAYLVGSELFGQSGHAMSNKDFAQVESMIGGEHWLANPEEAKVKLGSILQETARKRAANQKRMGEMNVSKGRTEAGAPAQPSLPAADGVRRFNPITGTLD